MTLAAHSSIRLAAPATTGPQSRVRTQFNKLVKKLEAERAKLALWHTELPKIVALANDAYQPLARTFDLHRKSLLLALDRAYDDKSMGKKDKQKLAELICSTALALLEPDEDDEVVKALYNKHSGRDFDQDMEEEKADMIAMVAAMTGVELDEDADVSSPAAFFKSMQEKMVAQARDEEQAEQARPAKLSARETRHQAQAAQLKQSVRDIFRKLASALHPDRETDPAEHARKNALMQRVNAAYAANDLLGLLELQFEIDQIDQSKLDSLGDERIRQYNQMLTDQVREISFQIQAMESAFTLDMGWEPGRRRSPMSMMKSLRADIKEMRGNIKRIEADLAAFGDIRQIKVWLKGYNFDADDDMDETPWF